MYVYTREEVERLTGRRRTALRRASSLLRPLGPRLGPAAATDVKTFAWKLTPGLGVLAGKRAAPEAGDEGFGVCVEPRGGLTPENRAGTSLAVVKVICCIGALPERRAA